jgi:hypothetical protein
VSVQDGGAILAPRAARRVDEVFHNYEKPPTLILAQRDASEQSERHETDRRGFDLPPR